MARITKLDKKIADWNAKVGGLGYIERAGNCAIVHLPDLKNAVELCELFKDDPYYDYEQFLTRNICPSCPSKSGFKTPSELKHRCLYGIEVDWNDIKGMGDIPYREDLFEQKIIYDTVGVIPDVMEYLYGNPECMMIEDDVRQRMCLNIGLNPTMYWDRDVKEYRLAGYNVLKCLRVLIAYGFDIGLTVARVNEGFGNCLHILTRIPIKYPEEPLEMTSLLFPLTSPAFLRGLLFNVRAILPDTRLRSSSVGEFSVFKHEWESARGLEDPDLDFDYVFELENCVTDIEEVWHRMVVGLGLENTLGEWDEA